MTNRKHLSDHKRQWEKATIEECFDILKGKGLSKAQLAPDGIYSCILYGELFTTYSEVIDVVYSSTNSNGGEDSKAGDILLPASTTTKGVDLARASALLQDNVRLGGDINILRPKRDLDSAFMAMYLNVVKRDSIAKKTKGTTIHHLHGSDIKDIIIELPEMSAQTTISNLIRTIDQAAKSIKKLIEKKKLIKLGVMQELLTGKRRLPGFTGEWETIKLSSLCTNITTGSKDVNEGNPNGEYPFFTCSRSISLSDQYSFDTEAILIAGNGEIGTLHYYHGKFEAYQRTYVLSEFTIYVKYLVHYLEYSLAATLQLNKIGSSIPYIKIGDLTDLPINSPKDNNEIMAIANVLDDIDYEIDALSFKLDKYIKLKQAMMQELLTGRIRLL